MLEANGSFMIENWPANLGCVDQKATSVGDIDWQDLRSFGGTWAPGPEGYSSHLSLTFEDVECGGVFWLDAWVSDGETVLRKWLNPDPEDDSESFIFDLHSVDRR